MKKFRILLILAVLVALMIPVAVQAAGTFYCSTLISSGGDGSYAYPWACSTNEQFNTIVYDYICERYGGGYLYRIYSGSYVYYQIEWIGGEQPYCDITYTMEYPGYPPNTGPDFPIPLLLGAAASVGLLLVGAGLVMRRRKSEI
jgi:LPXTG-motif cell wall-anchored protein